MIKFFGDLLLYFLRMIVTVSRYNWFVSDGASSWDQRVSASCYNITACQLLPWSSSTAVCCSHNCFAMHVVWCSLPLSPPPYPGSILFDQVHVVRVVMETEQCVLTSLYRLGPAAPSVGRHSSTFCFYPSFDHCSAADKEVLQVGKEGGERQDRTTRGQRGEHDRQKKQAFFIAMPSSCRPNSTMLARWNYMGANHIRRPQTIKMETDESWPCSIVVKTVENSTLRKRQRMALLDLARLGR